MGGGQLSGTLAADARWHAALRFYPKNDNWTIRAAATYQHKPFQDVDDRYEIGFSARDGRDSSAYIIKAGWLTNLNSLGYTAFSADYSFGSDARLAGDEAESIGIFVQQKWDAIGLDLYGGLRRYDVDRPDIALKPMNVLALGAMYTFLSSCLSSPSKL